MNKVEYKCCICHKELENKDTIRLAKQLYGISYVGGHQTVKNAIRNLNIGLENTRRKTNENNT